MGEKMRLDKFLVSTGEYTRTTAKAAIRAGRVFIDGAIAKFADQKIDTTVNSIAVDGEEIIFRNFYYIMLNKPAGYLSATEDCRDATVLDLLPQKYKKIGLFPAGRLDKDAEGFLLLTNDGVLAHQLMLPRHHVEKIYEVTVDGKLNNDDIEAFKNGVVIDGDYKCMPAKLEILQSGETSLAHVTVMEGRFHQVKKMFLARNKCVIYLKRIFIGGVKLDFSLQIGDFRELCDDEIACLRAHGQA